MNSTLQPVLSCGQAVASDISVFLSQAGTTYDVYLGVALLERVGADPEAVARKMLVGRLRNAGVSLRELGQRFGHDPRTVKKWAAALLSNDIDEMARAFVGREGTRKVTPELMRYVWQLYRQREMLGRNYREAIIGKVAEVFAVRLSTTTVSEIFAADPERRQNAAPERNGATGLQNGDLPGSDSGSSVKQSPAPLPVQTAPSTGGTQLIHHAGQVLFTAGMAVIADPFQRQLVAQILQGAVNIEQSKTLCGRSLSVFVEPVVGSLKAQRDALDAQADPAAVIEVYRHNAELLVDGPNRGDVFFFDPHVKEYTGQLKVLKGWCGRRHGVVKSVNLDCFHTRSGRPCFIQHYSPYYDMRERFFMSLAQFDLLFAEDRRTGRTFVIDRAIYSLATLQAFVHDHVITWEKGYGGGDWREDAPTITFSRTLPRNNASDLQPVVFACQQSAWRRDPSFRRLIVRLTREGSQTIELSIITSHPDMDVQDVVWAICRRWLQENDFKYLDTHFGINQLTSRDSLAFRDHADRFEDRPVDSVEYRECKAQLKTLETRLGGLLLRQRKADRRADDLARRILALEPERNLLLEQLQDCLACLDDNRPEPRGAAGIRRQATDYLKTRNALQRQLDTIRRRQQRLRDDIAQADASITPLETQLCDAIRKQSRLQLLIDGNYELLDTRKKSLMDALRVTASNIFRNVQEPFRAIYDNFRDDHVVVRLLSRCSGVVEHTDDVVVFRLWLPGTLQPHRVRAIEALLAQIEESTNALIPFGRPLRLKLTTGPIVT